MKAPVKGVINVWPAVTTARGRALFSLAMAAGLLAIPLLVTDAIVNSRYVLAQATKSYSVLPTRIFDISQQQLSELIKEVRSGDQSFPRFEDLQRIRELYELVAQFTQYISAIDTVLPNADSKIYAKISKFQTQLLENGITPQVIALIGLRVIDRGDWSKLDPKEMENFEVTSAVFIGGVKDPVLAANANLNLADVYSGLGKSSVSFDRFREATQWAKMIAAQDTRVDVEIKLASNIIRLSDQRRFGLLTLLVQNNTTLDQRRIIDVISKNWTSIPTVADLPDDISKVWAQRIEHQRNPIFGEKQSEQINAYAKFIDTDLCLVLVAGYGVAEQNLIIGDVIRNYIAQDKALRGVQLLSTLPSDSVNTQSYIDLITYFAKRDHLKMVKGLAKVFEKKLTATNLKLIDKQRTALSVALARAGQTETLQRLFVAKLFLGETVDQDRTLAVAEINNALSGLAQGSIPRSIEVKESLKDLRALAGLIEGRAGDSAPDIVVDKVADLDLWVRAGELLWREKAHRLSVVEFENSAAPAPLKLALARGATLDSGFHVEQEASKKLMEALKASAILQKSIGPRSVDAILVSASLGQKIEDPGELLSLTAESDLNLEYTKRASRFDALQNQGSDFLSQTAELRKISDYQERVSAFRELAEVRAERLDVAQWLNVANDTAIDARTMSPTTIVQTDGPAAASNNLVAIKNTDEGVLLASSKRPHLPNHYPSSTDVYSILPMPFEGAADATIGGESRVDRLTRFASEHYKGATNLGVREHIYASTGNITPKFIFVRGGVLSMGQLLAKIGHFNPEMISENDGNIVLRVPLIVGPDATLVVSGAEFKVLRLSQQKGALIVNAGKIYFSDVEVTGFDDEAQKPATLPIGNPGMNFRPFILSLSASQTFAANSKFEALGYSAGSAYGFSLSSGPADEILRAARSAAPTGMIVDSSFENLYYGFYAFEAANVQLVGNEYRDGVIYGLDPHDRSVNLLMAFNSAYGTHKKHGIIISREVDDSMIIGNLSFDNAGSGVMLDRESMGTIVYANTLMNNMGDGFAALESPCALVSSNVIEANGRVGIKVRNSWDIQIEANLVRGNKGAGIEGYTDRLEDAKGSESRNFRQDPYSPISTMTVVRNQLQDNPTAIQTHGVAATTLFDNHFVNQAPKLFSGDAKNLAIDLFARSSAQPVTLVSICVPKIVNRKTCPLVEHGFIVGHSTNRSFTGQSTSAGQCVAKKGATEIAPMKSVN